MSIELKHILLVSSPLYGHAIPLLQLGLKLTHFHHVTFAVYEDVLKGLREEIKNAEFGIYGPIRLTGIKSSKNDDVIDMAHENPARKLFEELFPVMREFFLTIPVKNDQIEASKSSLFTLVGDGIFKGIDVAIADNFLGGQVSLVHQRGIPFYLFNSARAWLTLAFFTLDIEDPESFKLAAKSSPNFVRRSVGIKYLDINLEENKDLLMENCKTMKFASGIIINSVREAELDVIAEILATPTLKNMQIFCVGPLTSESVEENTAKKKSENFIKKWLNFQRKETVIYVSFGSIAVPSPEEIKEIGEALLLLETPFIWSLKTIHHVHLPQKIQEVLKTKNENEIETENETDRPFLIVPWAPQKDILAHPSTKLFVTHCGWNSSLETLTFGVPMVAWPMFADQLINAEWLENEGVGKLIHGTGILRERIVPAEEIVSVLRQVSQSSQSCVQGVNGENFYTVAARKWQAKIRAALAVGGSSYEELQQLVRF